MKKAMYGMLVWAMTAALMLCGCAPESSDDGDSEQWSGDLSVFSGRMYGKIAGNNAIATCSVTADLGTYITRMWWSNDNADIDSNPDQIVNGTYKISDNKTKAKGSGSDHTFEASTSDNWQSCSITIIVDGNMTFTGTLRRADD